MSTALRAEAEALFRAAIDAVQPTRLIREAVQWHNGAAFINAPGLTQQPLAPPVTVIGAGKAAAAMALGCEQALSPENVNGGVVAPDGTSTQLTSIRVYHAPHPLPNSRSVIATKAILDCLGNARASPILCLISGGASSLLVSPRPPLTLEEKVETNRLLLECGADIIELNTIRKHLSQVKGGGLLRHCSGTVVSLLISDVVGNDPATIGSGPTLPDPTTFDDAWRIILKYNLARRMPPAVVDLIHAGRRGKLDETVKPGTETAARCKHAIIGSNLAALQGAAAAAAARGWQVYIRPDPLIGETRDAANSFAAELKRKLPSSGSRQCIIAGGETTVRVRGRGRGGRNQEFALAMAERLDGKPVVVLSAGTDGIDGPTDAAGAFADGQTYARAGERGMSIDSFLAQNDSYSFFQQLGDLFICGATGTNVMDIKIALLAP